MMIVFKLIIILLFMIAFTFLFKRAAGGSLSLTKLNCISFTFYSLLIFDCIGAALIFLGDRQHYMIQKIMNEETIPKTLLILAYTLIMLPFVIWIFNYKINRGRNNITYESYIDKQCINKQKEDKNTFKITLCFALIGLICTIYIFYLIGYIPFIDLFTQSVNQAEERIRITRYLGGGVITYIKNIGMQLIVPFTSYVSYCYACITNKKKWKLLFLVMFIASIFVKTYNYEKAPLIYYLFWFYCIDVIIGNVKNIKKIIILGFISLIIILFYYIYVSNQINSILTIHNGPIGRIIFSQLGGLFLHVDIFPEQVPYLSGASFPSWMSILIPNASWTRSGQVVMQLTNPSGVANGTAGVVNTLFCGEAYANFGVLGIIIAPIIAGISLSLIHNFLLYSKKKPINIVIYIQLFAFYTGAIQGGFTDFIYSANIVIIILLYLIYKINSKLKY